MKETKSQDLEHEVARLEDEVRAAEGALTNLGARIRTAVVEADAARDPRQFRHLALLDGAWVMPALTVGGLTLGLATGGVLLGAFKALFGG